ncbi:MAG: hypothetical protein AAGB31_13070 [Bdellovibrio sp.]
MNLAEAYFSKKYFSEKKLSEFFEESKSDAKVLYFDRVFRRHHVFNDPINFIDPKGLEGDGLGDYFDMMNRINTEGNQAVSVAARAYGTVGAGLACGGAAALAAPSVTAVCLANSAACTEAIVAAASGAAGSLSNSSDVPDPTKAPMNHVIDIISSTIMGVLTGN